MREGKRQTENSIRIKFIENDKATYKKNVKKMIMESIKPNVLQLMNSIRRRMGHLRLFKIEYLQVDISQYEYTIIMKLTFLTSKFKE